MRHALLAIWRYLMVILRALKPRVYHIKDTSSSWFCMTFRLKRGSIAFSLEFKRS